jgi:hypothetical protein
VEISAWHGGAWGAGARHGEARARQSPADDRRALIFPPSVAHDRRLRAASSVLPLAKIRMARDAISSYRFGLTDVGF